VRLEFDNQSGVSRHTPKLLRQSDTLQQILKARVGAQRIEFGIRRNNLRQDFSVPPVAAD
jgi:hypothetical protein